MTERWLPVVGFEGLYEASSCGRIRSLNRVVDDGRGGTRRLKGRVLSSQQDKLGYQRVALCRGGVAEDRLVSRLVCEAFHGPAPSPEHQAAHGDGNPAHNWVRNLRWTTPTQNMADQVLHGTRSKGERHGRVKLTAEQALEIRRLPSTDLARVGSKYGVAASTVSRIQRGRLWRHLAEAA